MKYLFVFILFISCSDLINREEDSSSNSERCILSYLICTRGEIREDNSCTTGFVAQACLGNSL
jgi:hypothetical protein